MNKSRPRPKEIWTTESGSLATSLVWGLVILVAFIGVLFFAYQAKRQLSPPEYEGKIVDKWAGYSHSDEGSFPYFRLLVETDNGKKLTVTVDRENYERAKVGMRIKKTQRGIELSSLTASPPEVRKRIKIKGTLRYGFAA